MPEVKPPFKTLLQWRKQKDGQIKAYKTMEEWLGEKLRREFAELKDLNEKIENYY